MAVVLSAEDNNPFSSSTGLRRSRSQSRFDSSHSTKLRPSSSSSRLNDLYPDPYHDPFHLVPDSSPCSTPSSPPTLRADSDDLSYPPTPATTLSLDDHCEDEIHGKSEHSNLVPAINDRPYFGPLEDLEPPPSPGTGDSYTVSPSEDVSATTSRPGTPDLVEHAEDDTAVKQHPTHHVDYLSHNWREEDIWSSWRYIVSKRGEFTNGPRLENASWRTWMKNKYHLKTISPETLNWLKDCDVTWLYGPLQTHNAKLSPHGAKQGRSALSRHGSYKKPILKKRSMSEIMLQRSLSSSSLLKQATAAIQAQEKDGNLGVVRPSLHRACTDYMTFPFSSRRRSYDNIGVLSSTSTSGLETPATERKHIHFDEQVKQCIAVEVKGDDDEDELNQARWGFGEDSDSDDDAIMMKPTKTKKKPIPQKKPQPTPTTESKTIAMLPSTTLKYRVDSPEPTETAMKHSRGFLRGSLLSPSPSQETLRPSKPSRSFHFDEDEDPDSLTLDTGSSASSPSPSESPSQFRSGAQGSSTQSGSTAGSKGLRRTESGMLMPADDSGAQPYPGLVGRVVETVNTARDIVHVIWNVGWR